LTCEYLREVSKQFEIIQTLFSGACGKMIHEKNRKQKSCYTVPLILRCEIPKNTFAYSTRTYVYIDIFLHLLKSIFLHERDKKSLKFSVINTIFPVPQYLDPWRWRCPPNCRRCLRLGCPPPLAAGYPDSRPPGAPADKTETASPSHPDSPGTPAMAAAAGCTCCCFACLGQRHSSVL
jgi:hypothetical protein